MGATSFSNRIQADNASIGFKILVEEARYEYGHGGYTGTIAEKDDFVMAYVPPTMTPREFLKAVIRFESEDKEDYSSQELLAIERAFSVYDDKWGPALCIELNPGDYCFCGWASS